MDYMGSYHGEVNPSSIYFRINLKKKPRLDNILH